VDTLGYLPLYESTRQHTAQTKSPVHGGGPHAGEMMSVVQAAMMGKLPYTALRDNGPIAMAQPKELLFPTMLT
jgi:hypothetical protein